MQLAIVIPTYDDGPLLKRAVSSALAIDAACRVVVVDDGGKQAAVAVLSEFCQDDRLRLVRQPNAGPSVARNRGIDEALERPPDWLLFLDADDQLLPDAQLMVDDAARQSAVAAVGGRVEIFDNGRQRPRPAPAEWADRVLPRPADVFRPIQLFATTGMAVRSDILRETGERFDPEIRHGQDREFLRRIANYGPVWVSSRTVVRYTKHAGGQNVSGHRHLEGRVASFVRMVQLHHDAQSDRHFEEAGRRLMNQCSKHDVTDDTWNLLCDVFRRCGWCPRKRSVLRRRLRRLVGRTGARP